LKGAIAIVQEAETHGAEERQRKDLRGQEETEREVAWEEPERRRWELAKEERDARSWRGAKQPGKKMS
jgi:hypothetical protein